MNVRASATAVVRNAVEPYGYVVVYLGWAWFFWGLVVLSGRGVWTFPNVALFYVGALSPAIGGILMLYRTRGRRGLRTLWDRVVNVDRVSRRWYAVVVFLFPAINVLAAALVVVFGTPDAPPLDPGSTVERLARPLSLVAFLGFTVGAGLVEETGSTGYFLDRLMETWSPVGAGLISGTVWASWHVPLFLMEGYYSQASYQPVVWRFFASFVLLETLFGWMYSNTRRSVLAAVLFHTMINLTGEVLAPSQQVRWYAFYLTALLAVAVWLWQRR